MPRSLRTVLAFKSYQNQAEVLFRNYVLADPYIPYSSVIGGILMCKMVYDLNQVISTFYFRSYKGLTKIQRIDWNNRGISTLHAVFISIWSLYFVFWSEIFSDDESAGLITLRNSPLSTFVLGAFPFSYTLPSVSWERQPSFHLRIFLADFCWLLHFRPWNDLLTLSSLGGDVFHHSIRGIAVAYSIFTGEGQLYTFMVLISEVTTPMINIRWYLDVAGLKRSTAYLINGLLIISGWLVARILLFVYMIYHVYQHHAQVMQMDTFGLLWVFFIPVALAIMNLVWFGKILKGLKKTLAKRK